MNHIFHPEAEEEFLQAVDYYEQCEPGLGLDFAWEVQAAIGLIEKYPKAWPSIDDAIRRCQTNRFPYALLYSQESSRIFTLAVMHLHREPGYWKHRSAN